MRELFSLVRDFSQGAAKYRESEFSIRYQIPEKSPTGIPTIYMDGPEQYVEYGGLVRLFDSKPRWLSKSARFDKQGVAEIRGLHKRHMLSYLFNNIADNLTLYLGYELRRRARFLSDMRGETEFLDWMTRDDDEMAEKTDLLRELQHTVPVLGELPIATILRIRQQERMRLRVIVMLSQKCRRIYWLPKMCRRKRFGRWFGTQSNRNFAE
jgi:hypothetical protein